MSRSSVSTAWVDEFVERWGAAWNSHDPEEVLELLTDDIVYDDSGWPQTMHGKADVREFLEHSWRAFPDLTFELVTGPHVATDGPRAAYWWKASASHRGPLDPPGIPATGRRIEFDGVDIHEYREGKVAKLRIIFNMTDVVVQLGLLPAPGSKTEKVMVGMQKLRSRFTRS